MTVRFLNTFTCNARLPSHWRSGTLCLLVEPRRKQPLSQRPNPLGCLPHAD